MSPSSSNPLQQAVSWLARHASFPQTRLAPQAETLFLMALLAEAEEAAASARFLVQRRDGARDAAQRAHALRRAQVHFKCDNSAKV